MMLKIGKTVLHDPRWRRPCINQASFTALEMPKMPAGEARFLTGFTLIELMLVVAIMGIMVAGAIPSFSGLFAETRLKTAAGSLASTINFAGRLAVTERLRCRVNCDLEKGRYWLSVEKDPVDSPKTYSKLEDSLGRVRLLPQGINIKQMCTPRGVSEKGEDYITASPNGKVERGFLHLINEKGEIYTILISKTFSRVKTFDYEYQPW